MRGMSRRLFALGLLCAVSAPTRAQVPTPYNCVVERAASVLAIRPQSDGRVIIGGSFDLVNGVPRNNLARLNADGSLDMNWNPDANGSVHAIAVAGTNIYVGGQFTTIGGLSRPRLAKLNYNTGAPLDGLWAIGANNTVRALALSGEDIFVGGNFTTIGGSNRNYIAKVRITGSIYDNFTNGANGEVRALLYHGGDLFAGGDFTTIGGATRSYVAKLHYFDGSALDWNPKPNNSVWALADTTLEIIMGGFFTMVTNRPLNYLAMVDAGSGSPVAGWDAGITSPGYVDVLDADSLNLYVGGFFTQVNGLARNGFVKMSNASAVIDRVWTNEPDNDVGAIYVSSATNVLIGGRFARMGAHRAISIARMTTNGVPSPGFPVSAGDPGIVFSIATQSDGRVVVGGSFDSVMSQDFPHLVRFNADGSIDTNWTPRPNGSVDFALPYGTSIYAVGGFTNIGGQNLRRIARLNDTDGQVAAGWTNQVYGTVDAATVDSNYFYVGGGFTNISGTPCRYIARTRHSDNRVDTSWLPAASGTVMALGVDASYVYCGGAFRAIGAQPVSNLARVSRTTGLADPAWAPNPDNWVRALAVRTSHVYAVGDFNYMAGESIYNLARVSKTAPATADTTWQAFPVGRMETLAMDDHWAYLGGTFDEMGGESISNVARVNLTNAAADASWHPQPDFNVYAILPRGEEVAVGGMFGAIGGMSRAGYAWLEPFHLEEIRFTNAEPQIVWRSGEGRLYTVQYALSAFGPYSNAKSSVLGTAETNAFTDSDRGPNGVFYRVFEQ